MLRILTGGVHSSVTQQKTIRALEMFKSLTCGAHTSASLFLNESVWYRWIIQRSTFIHASGERRRPKPSGATAPATARGTDGSPRGLGRACGRCGSTAATRGRSWDERRVLGWLQSTAASNSSSAAVLHLRRGSCVVPGHDPEGKRGRVSEAVMGKGMRARE